MNRVDIACRDDGDACERSGGGGRGALSAGQFLIGA